MHLLKPVIIIPTYNERANIKDLIASIRSEVKASHPDVLVVDSASPDGTAEVVLEIQQNDPKIFLLQQGAKRGLGMAYQEGMAWALGRGYDRIMTMDADFSHHPMYLDSMLKESKSKQLVVGSRYVPGGELKGWPLRRKMLSRFANWYAGQITGLPFSDLTSGFNCFHDTLLREILRDPLKADGYAFLIALKFLAFVRGTTYVEIPIVFSNRTKGESKISKRVILESVFFVWKCSLQRHHARDHRNYDPSRNVLTLD
jgi:dolichol-phosphate mannosyltransferase